MKHFFFVCLCWVVGGRGGGWKNFEKRLSVAIDIFGLLKGVPKEGVSLE